jgi:hypothetical protein
MNTTTPSILEAIRHVCDKVIEQITACTNPFVRYGRADFDEVCAVQDRLLNWSGAIQRLQKEYDEQAGRRLAREVASNLYDARLTLDGPPLHTLMAGLAHLLLARGVLLPPEDDAASAAEPSYRASSRGDR